ncbi:MDR family MFS transporter [Actinoplanes sp. NPDC051859]|uniref:MDR family MFS transporter n=1 Tax=Actinoplanes sp. NPDC051859 TaxID=3363909 RepID=UPI0037AD79BC
MTSAPVRPSGARQAVRQAVGGLPAAFWWLWASSLINRIGAFVATFLAFYLTADQGYPASFAGLVVALYGGGSVVASLIGGVLTDRLGRRPTMLVSQVATGVSVALLGFVQAPVAVSAIAFVVGVASNASRPAVQVMMADIVAPADRVRAFSLNYWAINLGFAVSAAGAGLIAEVSYRAGFLVEAALTLCCAVLIFIKVPESRPEPTAVDATTPRPGGPVWRDKSFMTLVTVSFVVALIFQQGFVGLSLTMADQGFSSGDFGLVIALNGILIVALQIPVTRLIERRDPRRLLVLAALGAGGGFALTAFAHSMVGYAATVLVWTVAEIVSAPTQSSLVVALSPLHGRGRYQGVFATSIALAAVAAPAIAGLVVARFGADWLWGLCAVLGVVAALGYAALSVRITARTPTPEEGRTS